MFIECARITQFIRPSEQHTMGGKRTKLHTTTTAAHAFPRYNCAAERLAWQRAAKHAEKNANYLMCALRLGHL